MDRSRLPLSESLRYQIIEILIYRLTTTLSSIMEAGVRHLYYYVSSLGGLPKSSPLLEGFVQTSLLDIGTWTNDSPRKGAQSRVIADQKREVESLIANRISSRRGNHCSSECNKISREFDNLSGTNCRQA